MARRAGRLFNGEAKFDQTTLFVALVMQQKYAIIEVDFDHGKFMILSSLVSDLVFQFVPL